MINKIDMRLDPEQQVADMVSVRNNNKPTTKNND